MSLLSIVNLSHFYGDREVLKKVDLHMEKGNIFALMGPTGSGKTTLLRVIDGLENPTSGGVYFAGEDVFASSRVNLSIRRRMGMVFQKPVVFNTSVQANLAYPLKMRNVSKRYICPKVEQMLKLVELEEYRGKNAQKLSGGEMQRVALGQAMITEPELLLLDEPTANLDPASVALIERLILDMNRKKGITTLIATHDMAQGERLADRAGVLIEGRLVQTGSPQEVFNYPYHVKVAQFTGKNNVLKGVVVSNDNGTARISVEGKIIEGISSVEPEGKVHVCIKPESITLSLSKSEMSSARNFFSASIQWLDYSGPLVRVGLRCPFPLVALVTKRSSQDLQLKKGKQVYVCFKSTAVHIIVDKQRLT